MLLPGARAVRERIDWAEVTAAATDRPYAEAFLFVAVLNLLSAFWVRLGFR